MNVRAGETAPSIDPAAGRVGAWVWFPEEQAHFSAIEGDKSMSLGLILVIVLVVFLLGGFSGRFGDYGYGYGGVGVIGTS